MAVRAGRPGINADHAVMGFNDLVGHGKAQAGTMPLGRIVGIKNMGHGISLYTRTCILHNQTNSLSAGGQRQRQLSPLRHGVKGVEADVEQGLTHPFAVYPYLGHMT